MTWIRHHEESERLAAQAEDASRKGHREHAQELYSRAADAEREAIVHLDPAKTRTLGASAVSAVSLYYKASLCERAEAAACDLLRVETLPPFAKDQLRALLQSIWSEQARDEAPAPFASGEVLVSLHGGEVVSGGAPLDLILDKVKTVQSLLHRTAELLRGHAHRRRGAPPKAIQDGCRPWLFQAAPGSYRFAVAIQQERQPGLLDPPLPTPVTESFLRIVRAGIADPDVALAEAVTDADYRGTFLKLTRNLAADGTTCKRLDIRAATAPEPISLDVDVRKALGDVIRKNRQECEKTETRPETLHGVLRAVHLDADWLEVTLPDGSPLRVHAVGEEVDDVIGPLVNRPVIVHTTSVAGKHRFLDMESGTGP